MKKVNRKANKIPGTDTARHILRERTKIRDKTPVKEDVLIADYQKKTSVTIKKRAGNKVNKT